MYNSAENIIIISSKGRVQSGSELNLLELARNVGSALLAVLYDSVLSRGKVFSFIFTILVEML